MRDEITDEHYYTLWEFVLYGGGSLVIHAFLHGCIIPHDVDTMKTYVCSDVKIVTYDCAACVFDKTPENFDKSIMDVFCKRRDVRNQNGY